ncbi:hypothetical protein ACFVOR_35355 [Streptomyces sp. NPDC057837]|uniref:hypothetical protein n=1 Tax=Streptomyces sp. NPDC057837 TaxID=3346260 RepID=UPI00369EDBF2
MPTACLTTALSHADRPAPERPKGLADRREGPALAEVLDLWEAEVPCTADALDHFFGDV